MQAVDRSSTSSMIPALLAALLVLAAEWVLLPAARSQPKTPEQILAGPPTVVRAGPADKTAGKTPQAEAAGEEEKSDLTVPLGEFFKLRAKSLGEIKEVFVDREKVIKLLPLERNARFVKAVGVRLGEARVTVVDTKDEAQTYRVRVAANLEYLNEILERRFPRASLKLSPGGDNVLLVEGNVESALEVDPILELLRGFVGRTGQLISGIQVTGPTQVQLEVCIAYVDRDLMRRVGFNFLQADTNNYIGSQVGNLIGVPAVTVRGGLANPGGALTFMNPGGPVGNAVLTGDANLFAGFTRGTSAFYAFLEAVKSENLGKVLASPTLIALNGRPADFLVGGEQPYPAVSYAGGLAVPNVEFKPFGVRLVFVPTVLGDGRLRLDVIPEVSTPGQDVNIGNGAVVPKFSTQRVHTTVEMESGQTLILGGLHQTLETASSSKVPVLGELPYIGTLFRRVSHEKEDIDLLIVVTPRLINPLSGCQRPPVLPGQEARSPTDCEFYLGGLIEAPAGPPAWRAPHGAPVFQEHTLPVEPAALPEPGAVEVPADAPQPPPLPPPTPLPPSPEGPTTFRGVAPEIEDPGPARREGPASEPVWRAASRSPQSPPRDGR
jgi:pilus assembly protein CpaC